MNDIAFRRAAADDLVLPAELDSSQRAVVELDDRASAAVIGAPGSGKTTTLIELVANRVHDRRWAAEHVLALAPSRATATRLRDVLARRLGVPTIGPIARTPESLAFEIAAHAAALAGHPTPRLVTGSEQDSDIGQLLAGHVADETGPTWPERLGPQVRSLRGFRTELRELFMRATEYGVSSDALRALAVMHGHPEWSAAADLFDEYLQVSGWLRPGQYDSVELSNLAATALAGDRVSDRVAGLRLVVVDDLQEATESTMSLLRALAARGVSIVAFGDPDVAANAFRGGEPDALGRLSSELRLPRARTLYLSEVHRHGVKVRALTSAVVGRIGAAAAGSQRAAGARTVGARSAGARTSGGVVPGPALQPIIRIEAGSASRQWAAVARVLRERHLIDGVAWNAMAVVLRGSAKIPAVARALAVADVPTRTSTGGRSLRDDPAARGLLAVVDIGMGHSALTPLRASDLLLSPFGGLDQLSLRRLRLAIRAEELAGGGHRTSDELLVDGLSAPGRFATIDNRIARRAGRLAATLAEVGDLAKGGGTIEELLWLAWERSGLAGSWRDQALGGGISAAEAHRNLDGILALFTAATRFVERRPGAPARVFLDAVLHADVPEDTLSPQPTGQAVLVTTPSGVVGLEFDVVAVVDLQEGIWPNVRLRGSLLNAQTLVDVATGIDGAIVDSRKRVLDDELRMFALAVSRASRQVVLAAVANDDEAPSVFFGLIDPEVSVTDTSEQAPLSLRGLTGRLRRELAASNRSNGDRQAAASALNRLAAEGVPGADPNDWLGLLAVSTSEPLYLEHETVPVSPSRLVAFESSPLDWFIELVAGSSSNTAMGLGSIIHWAMETATDHSVDGVFREIEGRWPELRFESHWVSEYHKRAARRLATGVAEYLADFTRDGATLVAAESRFELPLGLALLRGSIDRVERRADGSVSIVDLKTGATAKKGEIDEHPQLRAYQLAYAEGTLDDRLDSLGAHRSGGAKLLFVKDGVHGKSYRVAEQAPLTVDQLDGFRERIRQAALMMAAASFTGVVDLSGWRTASDGRAKLHRVAAVCSD